MPGFIGVPGLLVIGLVVLLFKPKRLPEMGRSMGRGFREFKDSITGPAKDEVEGEPAQSPVPPPPQRDETA